ncbi:haloacid dehalogenase-like hydrolase [Angomonas deanei]|uniref:Haloacid dehalogenase-like hydrolase/Sucrose-6F-phosphate phosphohydrolase, putative n=1 Tax=Angomonas deanei TaxID=59799 RepID=S9UKC6_9TRYP|nr:haloacid dehalogenase-like hydrolase [Angomonas deanei]EPY29455.1 haloacid dehalogenase-like hydrolase [Angomonas deanei]CAD2218901.1 haloacid dehalogenase-like hydrolase/Sucrose-6F-phosphate phosphohydrolase, putative [Angomonas deanei]|eukprot:EPY29383.1 haloacid dehalogenase-like hydrolase [Angomonas deanei]
MSGKGKIKAVFSDLDGTLLNENHKISEYTLNVLKRLKEETDVCFVVATGRPYADVFPTLTDCGLEPDYIITSNGARIHDRNRKMIVKHDIEPSLVKQIIDRANELSVASEEESVELSKNENLCDPRIPKLINGRKFTLNMYQEADWVVDMGIPEVAAAYHPKFQYKDIGSKFYSLSEADLQNVHELYFLGDNSNLHPLKAQLDAQFSQQVTTTFSIPFIVDCVLASVNKGRAITDVCERLGLNVSEVAAFGDGMNDEKMLATAGYSFTMANANPDLVAAVPKATGIASNEEDGVAKQLEKLFF